MREINILIKNDIDVNGSLKLLGDMDMYNELAGDFKGESEKRVNLLNQYKDTELNEYAVVAHSIKSDSKYLGFKKLAEVALAHELAGKEGNSSFLNENLDSLITELNKITNILNEYL